MGCGSSACRAARLSANRWWCLESVGSTPTGSPGREPCSTQPAASTPTCGWPRWILPQARRSTGRRSMSRVVRPHPRWAPIHRTALLMTYDVNVGNRTAMVFARADGGQPRLFTPSFRPGSSVPPSWSADSRTVFRDGRFEPSMRTIFRVDAQTGRADRCSRRSRSTIVRRGSTVVHDWRLLRRQDRLLPEEQRRDTTASLWSRDVTTGRGKGAVQDGQARWHLSRQVVSPDGRRLLFVLNPFDDAVQGN